MRVCCNLQFFLCKICIIGFYGFVGTKPKTLMFLYVCVCLAFLINAPFNSEICNLVFTLPTHNMEINETLNKLKDEEWLYY